MATQVATDAGAPLLERGAGSRGSSCRSEAAAAAPPPHGSSHCFSQVASAAPRSSSRGALPQELADAAESDGFAMRGLASAASRSSAVRGLASTATRSSEVDRQRKIEALVGVALEAKAAIRTSKQKRENMRQSEAGAQPLSAYSASASSSAAPSADAEPSQVEVETSPSIPQRGATQFEVAVEPQFAVGASWKSSPGSGSTQFEAAVVREDDETRSGASILCSVSEQQKAADSSAPLLCVEVPEEAQSLGEEAAVSACGSQSRPRPKLMLPLPLRRDVVAEPDSPAHDVKLLQAARPALVSGGLVGSSTFGSRRTPAALRSGRQLPARLQALDDETVMPRDVYSNMLKLGDAARGRLGYGQHKLTFTGPEGAPVLRITA